ncbi:hypothetical protein LN042_25900 [Kitasatospora sp. RB6PN24]|uniref:hypothetical protein n=1 Tax=Kitasatospora humi TaxID=2893891 RepID=UPI001E3ED651|nr:hypothetical protein [Kitasatospora humi]MCC9310461.1 hypothetical protein [Kitasatospora humi]
MSGGKPAVLAVLAEESAREPGSSAVAEARDCNTCRCLDTMASRAWVSDETGTYRHESALSDVRVRRRRHRAEGECSCLRETWGGEPAADQGSAERTVHPEALKPVEESATLRKLRAAMWPDPVR